MNNKIIQYSMLLLLIAVVAFMAKDFFSVRKGAKENPYEYDLKSLKEVDDAKISHKETLRIPVNAKEITALAVDAKDQIYVASNQQILILNEKGQLLRQLKLREKANCLTVTENNLIVVGMKNRVDIRKQDGSLQNSFRIPETHAYLTSVAVEGNHLFIADAGESAVYHYDLEGNFIKRIGEENPEKGIKGFVVPSPYFDLQIGKHNELWVVNPGRHQLEAYSFSGDLKSSWKKTSASLDGFSGCCNPSHIALLSNAAFVTSEKGLERIKIHAPTGEFLSVVAAPKEFKAGTKGLDLAVDSQDRILVLDPKQKMIRIFEAINNQ